MTFLHPHSSEYAKSELDIFQVPGTQASILKGQWVEYSPTTSLSSSSPIEFHMSAHDEYYVDLNHTQLYVKCKIIKSDGSNLAVDEAVGPVNLLLHSLFNQVNITLNDTLITHTNNLYPYRALFETLLDYGEDALTTQLTNALFYKDDAGLMDNTSFTDNKKNSGLQKRAKFFKESKSVELLGPLHADIFFQSKYLLNGVSLKIKLNRNTSSFFLMTGDPEKYKLYIEECKLYLRKVAIAPPVLLGHAHALLKGTAKYAIDRTVLKTITIPKDMRNNTQDNLFFGQIPKHLVLGLVDNEAFSGNYSKNPFNFHHYDLSYLALYLDNEHYPYKPLQPDFSNQIYLKAYSSLFSGTGKLYKDVGGLISRGDYPEGYTLYCYDLSPDLETQDHYSVMKHGDLRLDIQFSKPLPHTVNIIIYAVFENIIEIDQKRKVIYDYST